MSEYGGCGGWFGMLAFEWEPRSARSGGLLFWIALVVEGATFCGLDGENGEIFWHCCHPKSAKLLAESRGVNP